MKDKFHITIEMILWKDDIGKVDSIHNRSPELLAKREVIVIDIVNEHQVCCIYVVHMCYTCMCVHCMYVCLYVCMYVCVCYVCM